MDSPTQTPPPGNTHDEQQPPVRHQVTQLPSPTEVDPIPPIVKKPSKYRYIWLVLIVILVISVVGVGAYIIDQENRKVPSQVNALLTPTPEIARPLRQPTVAIPDLANYTDSALPYAFRYPKTLTLTPEKNGLSLTDPGGTKIITMSATDVAKNFINPDDYKSCSVVLNDAYTGKENKCVTIDNSKVDFGTNEATHFVYIEVGSSGGGYDIYQTATPALQFTMTFASGKEDGEKVFQKMLSTFTFPEVKIASPSPMVKTR